MSLDISELQRRGEAGSCVNQCILGLSFLHGDSVPVDYAEAFRWLSLAAKQGASRAVLNLAYMYVNGLGVPQNVPEAIRLYEAVGKPSDSSDAFAARLELARIFSRGLGVPKDKQTAARWYSSLLAMSDEIERSEEIQEARAYLLAHSG